MSTRLDFTTADLITCLICIREFDLRSRKPKVLHCGHTVCEECTEQLRDAHTGFLSVRCPTCRQFTSRISAQSFNTNFQLMGFLAEKEKVDRERSANGEKLKKTDQRFQFKMTRSNKMEIHVATKKDLSGTELYLRKDSDGTTHVVFVGKTGSTEEIIKYINENEISIEAGKMTPQIVYDEGRGRVQDRFVKVNNMAPGQSAMKCAKAPSKLEEVEFCESYELKASEESGSLKLELLRKEDTPKNGFGVFGGCMTKPTAKRINDLTSSLQSSSKPDVPAAGGPLPKRRRGRK